MIKKLLPLIFVALNYSLSSQIVFTADVNWPSYPGENSFYIDQGNQFASTYLGAFTGTTGTNYLLGTLPTSCNTYMIEMYDSWGDGWNGGGSVTIYANGVSCGTFALASGYQQFVYLQFTSFSADRLQQGGRNFSDDKLPQDVQQEVFHWDPGHTGMWLWRQIHIIISAGQIIQAVQRAAFALL